MASREYCSSISTELERWSEKLHKLSGEIGRISTGDKYRVLPQIEGLNIILAELDDRLCSLLESCSIVDEEVGWEGSAGKGFSTKFNMNSKERFDYEFGG